MNPMTKLLYGILADRNNLSIKNGWVDTDGRIFFIFKQSELCEQLDLSEPTIRKYLRELEEYTLLYRKKQGLNLPDLMYLLQIDNEDTSLSENSNKTNTKTFLSRTKNIYGQDAKKLLTNNINLNNINSNNIEKEKKRQKEDFNINNPNILSNYSSKNIDKKSNSVILPKEIIQLVNTSFIKRLKADRDFKGLDFDTKSYNSLIDAITITSEKDKVEILGMHQYSYFKNTLINILQTLNIKLTKKQNDYFDEELLGW